MKLVRSTLGTAIAPSLGQHDRPSNLESNFACSNAFLPRSRRYGGCYFQYNINDLPQKYKKLIREAVQCKVLGTFGCKAEVMQFLFAAKKRMMAPLKITRLC